MKEIENRLVVFRATCREETEGITANMYGVSFEDDGNILKLDHGNGCTTL